MGGRISSQQRCASGWHLIGVNKNPPREKTCGKRDRLVREGNQPCCNAYWDGVKRTARRWIRNGREIRLKKKAIERGGGGGEGW